MVVSRGWGWGWAETQAQGFLGSEAATAHTGQAGLASLDHLREKNPSVAWSCSIPWPCSWAPAALSPRLPPVMSELLWAIANGQPRPALRTSKDSSPPWGCEVKLLLAVGGSRTKYRDQVLRTWLKRLDPALPEAGILGLVS